MTDFADEETWVHHLVLRLRTLLRYVRSKQAEAIIKELIADAEARLEVLGDAQLRNPEDGAT